MLALLKQINLIAPNDLSSKLPPAMQYYTDARSNKLTGNYNDYFTHMTMAANLGHTDALTELTNDYYEKIHLKQDHHTMYLFYEATKQFSHSASYLGHMYREGLGVDKDFKEAIKYYESADVGKNTNAMIGLGIILCDENFNDNDFERGQELLYKAFESGNTNANYHCANLYQYGCFNKYPRFTYADMLRIYEREITNGNTSAMCDLAKILHNSGSCKVAHQLCRKAGDNNDGYGYALYALYIQKKNPDKAFEFYVKGVNLGCHHANIWLCEFVIEHPNYENKLLNYCADKKKRELVQMFGNKSGMPEKYITLYIQNRKLIEENANLKKQNTTFLLEKAKVARKNDVLKTERIHLIKENLILQRENAELLKMKADITALSK